MSIPRAFPIVALAAALTACVDQPTEPAQPEPKPEPKVLGVYTFTITGLDGSDPDGRFSVAIAAPDGANEALSLAGTLVFEPVNQTTFTEGVRPTAAVPNTGAMRFAMATYRVRNSSGAPVTNVTLIPTTRTTTIAGTPFFSLTRFDGSNADPALASQVVPTGAVLPGEDLRLRSLYPDVLQVFTEAEVAAIPLAPNRTGYFPYGFMVRNATDGGRTIPVAANDNDFGGLVTFAFRLPQQASKANDPFSLSFDAVAVVDTETRMTESIEERQDTAGVRRLRERATALGATTVTVLAGSPAADPFVTDYPGQRQICVVRTAGTAGAPTRRITMPGAHTELPIYRPGELTHDCQPYFRQGTPTPANYGMTYTVKVWAMDRYGNATSQPADTVTLTSTDGTAVMPPAKALASASANMNVTYTTYGNSTLRARGRRIRGETPVFVNGMTRTWTGNVDTNWLTNGDWVQLMHPGVQDSVVIPGDRPNYPLLVQNTTTAGVTMTDGASVNPFINLSSFDFTISGDLQMGNNGTFTGTGRVILTGNSNTIGGGLSNVNMRNLRVLGRYSTTSNINVTGGRIVVQGGRLRSQGYRVRVRPS